MRILILASLLLGGAAELAACATDLGPGGAPAHVAVAFGTDVAPAVRDAVTARLRHLAPNLVVVDPDQRIDADVMLAFGDTEASRQLVPRAELEALGSEGFIVRSGRLGSTDVIVADGNPLAPDPYGHGSLGDSYAAYALLEAFGYGFHHPLAPHVPDVWPQTLPTLDVRESPRWHIRGLHIHTQHPTELANMLSGWGPSGYDDRAAFERLLPEWDATLEWLLANRQNRVQWMPLWAASWAEFADSEERVARMRELVDRAHAYGLAAGVDVPITLAQQHAYRLIRTQGDLQAELAELRQRIDHVMKAGFDFLASESGTSEFTHSDDTHMVAWMNELARYLDVQYGKRAYMKIHVSQGQFTTHYTNAAGAPFNINLLPAVTDPRLGVMPHSVQHYAIDDPAPTYGNTNFEFMRTFLQEQAGTRETVWNPETAYWVSFDIDVPLFLPVYAQRRVRDLRLLAGDEDHGRMGRASHAGARMDGQVVFSSGWEWGYWLNDVVAARAAWNPHVEAADDNAALRAILHDVFAPYGTLRDPLADAVVETAQLELEELIRGPTRRNGQAYLQGFDTWDDVADLASAFLSGDPRTQPDRLGMVDMRNPLHSAPSYSGDLDGLLTQLDSTLDEQASRLERLAANAEPAARSMVGELADAARVTALRARQVAHLYAYVDDWASLSAGDRRAANLAAARAALDAAGAVIRRRENAYRVPLERIAGWHPGPTAYGFGYLWTVHSQLYWWRDEGKAVEAPISPCYLNIHDPIEVGGFGEGTWVDLAHTLASHASDLGLDSIAACLMAPAGEPQMPPNGLR